MRQMFDPFERVARAHHVCPCCERPFTAEEEDEFVKKVEILYHSNPRLFFPPESSYAFSSTFSLMIYSAISLSCSCSSLFWYISLMQIVSNRRKFFT